MSKFIEIEVELINNDPDDDTDYEALGIKRTDAKQMTDVILNTDDIRRVNKSATDEFKTVIWDWNGQAYNCNVSIDRIREALSPIAKLKP